MSDLIKREDAVKTVIRKCSPICDWQVGTRQYPDCVVAEINAIPSAEAVSRYEYERLYAEADYFAKRLRSAEPTDNWIPVSERLPSKDGQYLVFYEGTIIGSLIEIMWYGEPLMPNVDVSGKHFYRSDSEWGDIIYDEVMAWMPLPKPYKGGDTE